MNALRHSTAFALVAATVAMLCARPVAAAPVTMHNIHVEECIPSIGRPAEAFLGSFGDYAPHKPVEPGKRYDSSNFTQRYTPPNLFIAYVNTAHTTAKIIDFGLVAKGHTVAIVRDEGDFVPHARIEHVWALDMKIFPLGTNVVSCFPLHIKYADGKTWDRPHDHG